MHSPAPVRPSRPVSALLSLLSPVFLALTAVGASAAVVTWGTPKTITGAADVSTAGTGFGSWAPYNAGANGSPVNGVTFEGFDTLGISHSGFDGGGAYFGTHTTPDANYNSLLTYAAYSNGTTASFILNGNGGRPLSIGSVYEVQIWVSDVRALGGGVRSETVNGSAPLLFPADGTGMGQYIVGTFTADAATQTFTLSANASAQLNLVQVRSVPEPSGLLLGGLCLAGGLLRRRR